MEKLELKYIDAIAYQSYQTAVKRGKDVRENSCVLAVLRELKELSQAEKNEYIGCPYVLRKIADKLTDDEFVEAYSELISNTVEDERADIIIALATARYACVDDATFDALLTEAKKVLAPGLWPLYMVCVKLKMRYNKLRKD